MGYVYENAIILQYVRQKGGKAQCPQAGTSHIITMRDLQPARDVIRHKRRQELLSQQERASAAEATAEDMDEDLEIV